MTSRKGWEDLISPERKVFAARLRARRKELLLTQVNICEQTGLAVSYLSNLENAEANPSLEVMANLARALDVDIKYFFEIN
jgi:transcriptional regulator with XRE-family HTH domain